MATSGTYNFNDVQIDDLVREAYERCGIISDKLDGLQLKSAATSMNFILSQWVNKGVLQWPKQKMMMPMFQGQPTYALPDATVDILQLTAAKITRLNTLGQPFTSSGGIAQNAFDGNPATACTQTSANGSIGWNYSPPPAVNVMQPVWYVGIQSNAAGTAIYTLLIQYFDGYNWQTALNCGPEEYPQGEQVWYVLPTAYSAQQWQILETGGAILDIQELYFSQPNYSRILSRFTDDQYNAIANKKSTGAPAIYYVDRTKNPVFNVYPVPDNTYQYFIYNRIRYVQDIGKLINNVDTPQRFYEALVSALAAKLALKFAVDRFPELQQAAKEAFDTAARADTDVTPLRLQPNWYSYT